MPVISARFVIGANHNHPHRLGGRSRRPSGGARSTVAGMDDPAPQAPPPASGKHGPLADLTDDAPLVEARADEVLGGNASGSVIRGAAVRGATFVLSTGLLAIAFAFVLREVGPKTFSGLAVAIAIGTIVQSVGDTAISAVAQRMLVSADAQHRARLQAQLIGARFVVLPPVIAVGVLFALVAYDAQRTETTAIICASALITSVSAALITPLNVELRAGRASVVEFVRQIAIAIGLLVGVAASATVVGYAVVYLVASAVAVVVAFVLVEPVWRTIRLPSRATLQVVFRQAGWLAVAITVNSLFLKVLTVIASVRTDDVQTGLFAAATRVTEVVAALSLMVASVAYPLLSRAADDADWPRFSNAVRRVIEGVLLLVGAAAVGLIVGAGPLMEIFAGGKFDGAVPVLQVQAVALVLAATSQALVWALLALHAERMLVLTNLVGLTGLTVLGLVLVGPHGAEGAAYAGVGGEALLLGATLVALARLRPDAVPQAGRTVLTLLLVAACCAVGLVLPLPDLVAAVLAVGVFGVAALLLRLVPGELLAAAPLPAAARRILGQA